MIASVSQIAWNPEEEQEALALLQSLGVRGIELAPARIAPRPLDACAKAAEALTTYRAFGLTPVAFQGLLFQRPDLQVFGDNPEPCIQHLADLGQLAALLGARTLVFGSPLNRRIPEQMSRDEASARAIAFFSEVAKRLQPTGIALGIETNPVEYQCNFAVTLEETVKWVRALDHPAFRLHLDTGALAMTGEPVEASILAWSDLTAHVHLSEPHLLPLEATHTIHAQALAALRTTGYSRAVSLEMKRPPEGLPRLKKSIAEFLSLFS